MNKYFFYKFNILTHKVFLINKGNSKTELSKEVNQTLQSQDKYQIMLLKIEKKKTIKISFSFFDITKKLKIKKKEDKRAIQVIYYTLEYYEKNNIKLKDLKKVAELAFLNKLEKRLLAPKLINQIF